MFAERFVPRFPIRAARLVDEHERAQPTLARLHQREGFVTLVERAEAAGEQRQRVGMADERELAREKIFEGDELLVLRDHGIGRLFPRQPDVRAEAALRPRALVARLHDAAARARDDHEARVRDLAREFHGLLILDLIRLRAGRAEDGDLARGRIRLEQFEGVAQLAHRGLDHAHVAAVLNVGEQFQRALDEVRDEVGIVPAALERDEFVNAPAQLGISGRPFQFLHGRERSGARGGRNGGGVGCGRNQAATSE